MGYNVITRIVRLDSCIARGYFGPGNRVLGGLDMKSMKRIAGLSCAISIAFFMLLLMSAGMRETLAQSTPTTMTVQGRLTDGNGTALNGTFNICVRFWSVSSAGTKLFGRQYTNVGVNNGVYTIVIGESSDAADDLTDGTLAPTYITLSALMASNPANLWMGIKVSTDNEMTPRSRISSNINSLRVGDGTYFLVPQATGTAGYIAGAVGLGTSSPLGRFNVHTASGTSSQLWITTDTNLGLASEASIVFQSDRDGAWNDAIIGQFNDGSLRFTGNSNLVTPGMTLTDANLLGIGTTSPNERLHVGGTDPRIYLADATAPAPTTNRLYSVGGVLYWNGTNLSGGTLPSGSSGQTLRHDGISWVANSMVYNNGTSVGINTTNPQSTLDINGTLSFRAAGGTSYWGDAGGGLSGVDLYFNPGGRFRQLCTSVLGTNDVFFQAQPNTSAGYCILEGWQSAGTVVGTGGNTSPVIFQVNRTEYMRVASTGNVGIGTAGPVGRLTVVQPDVYTNTPSCIVYGGSGVNVGAMALPGGLSRQRAALVIGSYWDNSATNLLNMYNNLKDGILFVRGDGNVGIGTTTPSNKLHVEGTNLGSAGIYINSATPSSTASTLYNVGGALYWNGSAIGGGSVTGGGAATQVAYWSGASVITGNNNLYWNNGTSCLGIGTAAPSAQLHISGTEGILAQGTFASGTASSLGAGTRMMWYPLKAAFRAGYVDGTQWNDASIGNYSVAMGHNTRATGIYCTAFGQGTLASADYATAFGYGTTASSTYATAMGVFTTASNAGCTAMGNGSIASGGTSVAMGLQATSSGNFSIAAGNGAVAAAYQSVALGPFNVGGGTAGLWVATDPVFEVGIGTAVGSRANAMTILKNGNVGIGTVSPAEILDVNGRIRIAQAAVPGTVTDKLYNVAGTLYWNGTQLGAGGVTGSGTATRVAFWSGATSLSSNANLFWDNTNNYLGIGTATPVNPSMFEAKWS
jgi:hypothetical protein